MQQPGFRRTFQEVEVKQTVLMAPDISVTLFRLTHPNGFLGYLLQIYAEKDGSLVVAPWCCSSLPL